LFYIYDVQLTQQVQPFQQAEIPQVNNHQLKLVALLVSGFACPPLAAVSIHQLKLVVLKSEE